MNMNRKSLIILGLLGIIFVAGGLWIYDWVLGPTKEASAPIKATPVLLETRASNTPTVYEGSAYEPDPLQETPKITATVEQSPQQEGLVIFEILSEESQASFNIFEELSGQPKDVIGVTNQVAGQVAINPQNLEQIEFGPIQVNVRTFATDSTRRDQAIRNRILYTDQYEFVTFVPTKVSGLRGAGIIGQTYQFQITGDLTIRDITQPVTFDVTAVAESEFRLSGTATAKIKRSDFKLVIPSVPNVANVAEEFSLGLDFVLVPIHR